MRDLRICVAGDSLVTGVGDPKALGWVGRVTARTRGVALTVYNLGVAGDSIASVGRRLPVEMPPRLTGGDEHRLVVAAGVVDAVRGIEPGDSAAALASILATAGVSSFVVGPPPVGDAAVRNRLGELDRLLAGTCARARVPYVATYAPLSGNADWQRSLAESGDGVHPGQTGYGLLAYLVLHGGWYPWLDLPEPEVPPVRRSGPS